MKVKFYGGRYDRAYDHPGRVLELENTPMTRRIYKMITDEMRFELELRPEADQVIALVYRGVVNTVSMCMNRDGWLTINTYHPGIMDAVMSICNIRRGGDLNA